MLASAQGAVTCSNTSAPITAAPTSPLGETAAQLIDLKNSTVIDSGCKEHGLCF